MARDTETAYLMADVNIAYTEYNSYGDKLDERSVIHFHRKIKINNIAGLAYMLAQLDEALKRTKEMTA